MKTYITKSTKNTQPKEKGKGASLAPPPLQLKTKKTGTPDNLKAKHSTPFPNNNTSSLTDLKKVGVSQANVVQRTPDLNVLNMSFGDLYVEASENLSEEGKSNTSTWFHLVKKLQEIAKEIFPSKESLDEIQRLSKQWRERHTAPLFFGKESYNKKNAVLVKIEILTSHKKDFLEKRSASPTTGTGSRATNVRDFASVLTGDQPPQKSNPLTLNTVIDQGIAGRIGCGRLFIGQTIGQWITACIKINGELPRHSEAIPLLKEYNK